jgi:hypothetical protein
MNEDLMVLADLFKSVFDLLGTDIELFGVSVSPIDIVVTNLIIVMLLDIVLTYSGYERNE